MNGSALRLAELLGIEDGLTPESIILLLFIFIFLKGLISLANGFGNLTK